jgi:hypothetical protein
MKQTAIEWLSEQIINAKYTYKLRDDLENFLLEKAKEMEKQQIIDAYNEYAPIQIKKDRSETKRLMNEKLKDFEGLNPEIEAIIDRQITLD